MSWPVPASGPTVIDAPSAYVEHRKDAAWIAQLFGTYAHAIQERPAAERPILPETSAALAGFSGVEREIRQLLNLEEIDEFGPVRPTANSVELAKKIIFQLVQAGLEVPPLQDAGTDHDGTLRLAWENGPRFLELVVPRENHAAAYLYYSQGDQYNLQRDLTFNAVCERFNWLSA
jgi:hypothetical protein